MKLVRQRDNILISGVEDPKQKLYLAGTGVAIFSPSARAWIVPEWAYWGLNPYFHKLPIEGSPAPQPVQGNPLLLSLLPDKLQSTLYPFQQDVALRAAANGFWGMWHDAGVGKTITTLAAYKILKAQGKVDGMIVVGPENGRHVWCGPDSDSAKWIQEPGHYLESGGKLEPPHSGIIYTTASKIFMSPYQTWLTQRLQTRRFVLVFDEVHQCFPYETLVTTDEGAIPIGDVVELGRGREVLSFNQDTKLTEWKAITNRFRNESRDLVRVHHSKGSFECTADHKIWTLEKGYVCASELSNETLCYLPEPLHLDSELQSIPAQEILLEEVCLRQSRESRAWEKGGSNGRPVGEFASNEGEQPYVKSNNTGESLSYLTPHKTQTKGTRREWEAHNPTSTNALGSPGGGLGDRVRNSHQNGAELGLSDVLQSGHSFPCTQNSSGSKRSRTSVSESSGQGLQEGSVLIQARVVRVERLEQTSSSGRSSSAVYDIEVDSNHNFFANGVLVSNCSGALSKRYAQARAWAKWAHYRWLLSATPTSNYPDSFWSLYCILVDSDVSLDTWMKYFRVGQQTGSASKWHRLRLAGLGKYISYCTSVIRKKDVAPWLPPVTEQIMRIPLQGAQKDMYRALVSEAREEKGKLGSQVNAGAKNWRHKLVYLVSMASHPLVGGTVTGWGEKDIAKLDALKMLISSAGDQKMCIWSWHPKVLEWLADQVGRTNCVLYHGEISQTAKTHAVHSFNNDPSIQFFLANPSAAGTSLNLGAGTVRIFWDLGWSYVQFHQACERINRITRTQPITSYVLIAQNTVEEIMWKAIQRKQELASIITSEGTPEKQDTLLKEVLELWK